MSVKRILWHEKKHWWHLDFGKAKRLARIYDQIEMERVEPYKMELRHGQVVKQK